MSAPDVPTHLVREWERIMRSGAATSVTDGQKALRAACRQLTSAAVAQSFRQLTL